MRIGWVFILGSLASVTGPLPIVANEQAIGPAQRTGFLAPSFGTREVCTTVAWGIDGFRSECEIDTPRPNPALNGVCTTYYGHRVCH
jgi:hypothetical protein